MGRLNTGMKWETPLWYDNYETIWGETDPSLHARTLWSILNILINNASFKVANSANGKRNYDELIDFSIEHSNDINIFWCSATPYIKDRLDCDGWAYTKELFNLKNFIIFVAWTNIGSEEWHLRNKLYNEEYEADEYGRYSLASLANSDKNTQPTSHLLVTIATNRNGDIDQTGVDWESSKYPVWFANNVLFSWRGFPQEREWVIYWPSGRYTTSDTNYLNVALASICFQLHADAKDVDELLDMIRSTALTDNIRFDLNGDGDTNDTVDGQPESQPLQLINPAGVFKKYCMTVTIPSAIGLDETIDLTKEWYKGLIFDIPGAEVKIDGQWIAYDAKNKDIILAQNPMDLEWRLNGTLLRKYGYTPGQTLQGQILTVDDQWNGLRLEVPMAIQIK